MTASTADILRRLSALNIPADAMREVMSIIADVQANDDERKRRDRERKRAKAGKGDSVADGNSSGNSEEIPRKETGNSAEIPAESTAPRARVPYGEFNNIYTLSPPNPPTNGDGPDAGLGREGKGKINKLFCELIAVYPAGKTYSQPKIEQAISAVPEADWPALLAGARSYAADYRAKPTTHPIAPDRFVRERMFANYAVQSTGPPRVFVEVGTPEWEARVRAGHKPSLRTACEVNGRKVDGWHFPAESKTG